MAEPFQYGLTGVAEPFSMDSLVWLTPLSVDELTGVADPSQCGRTYWCG